MVRPLVSICCITYNHAPFIRQCLDGFLMQKGVDYEILIHDDCSTDGTTEIVKEYAAKYPEKIFPIYEQESLYKKVGLAGIDVPNYERAKGKYIAYCEGDDCWTDSLKLQKQVNFMEENPAYSICFHGFSILEYDSKKLLDRSVSNSDYDITACSYVNDMSNAQPLTMLFRASMFDISWRYQYEYYRDTHEIFHLLDKGRGRYLAFNGGVYHAHSEGVTNMVSSYIYASTACRIYMELMQKTPSAKYLKDVIKESFIWAKSKICTDDEKKQFKLLNYECWKNNPEIALNAWTIIVKRKIKKLLCKRN